MRYKYDKNPMTCGICQCIQGDERRQGCPGIDNVDECPTGEIPKLRPENNDFWFLFIRTVRGLFDGMGGINFSNIDYVLNLYQIPFPQRPIIHDKFLAAVHAIDEVRKKDHGKT